MEIVIVSVPWLNQQMVQIDFMRNKVLTMKKKFFYLRNAKFSIKDNLPKELVV